MASSVDTVCEPRQMVFDRRDTGRCRQKVDGLALFERHLWALEPCFDFRLRPKNIGRAAEDFGKLPSPSTLFGAQRFVRRVFAALVCPQADANSLLQVAVVRHTKNGDVAHQVP